ncbi:MAG: VTT domain-containing protein [Blastocatellia bacterium]|nr:VTT domain-containing protein [Blastocatellia bacterium]MCS7156808.1 VTT domain-containing protein [Blastocatellia bacterium]MCX7752766.1 VTT domain-containing protein [Blastocatellia bacterium]MDW8167499.1 VTT domain-containing protein [Acidobacteriota bacterium]MDW8256846.1 VTT domain-containing protein [Acidobacteriota bacterium]
MLDTFWDVLKDLLLGLGPAGMILIATLDSSLLSIPEINDVIVVTRVLHHPAEALYWPLLAATGSVLGCLLLYTLARVGGEAFLRQRFSPEKVRRVERLYAQYGAFVLLIPALCPPPAPFKIFVATAGALRYPRMKFILTILLARSARYYIEGALALIYGHAILRYMREHGVTIALGIGAITVIGYGIVRVLRRRAPLFVDDLPPSSAANPSSLDPEHRRA